MRSIGYLYCRLVLECRGAEGTLRIWTTEQKLLSFMRLEVQIVMEKLYVVDDLGPGGGIFPWSQHTRVEQIDFY